MQITGYKIKIIDTYENDRVLAEERTQLGAPVLTYNGGDDKYTPLITGELAFNISVPGAADGALYHLYTGNDTRYRVELTDQDDILLWAGFLMPDQYAEPYQQAHLFVAMNATDGVGRIKGKTLPAQYYEGKHSVIKLIAECLKLTGLNQPINFAPAIVPVNGFRWDEIAVDCTNYRDDDAGVISLELRAQKQQKKDNAYDILERLVKNIGCVLYSYRGQWDLVGINRRHEAESEVFAYNANGVYTGMATLTRAVSAVRFEATPTVSVVSPWKRVNVTWSCDEEASLLPDDIITEAADKFGIATENPFIDFSLHGRPDEAPLKYWQGQGGIELGIASQKGEYVVDYSTGSVYMPVVIGPFNLRVGKKYVSWAPYHVSGETEAGSLVNYATLKSPKYVQVSDPYKRRLLKLKFNVFGNGGSRELIDTEKLQNLFRIDVWCGNTLVLSNRPGMPGAVNFKFEVDFRDGSETIVTENPDTVGNVVNFTPKQITGKLEKENITLPNNGFLNVRVYAPVTPVITSPEAHSPDNPVITEFTVSDFELEYTALDEWFDALVRTIDYTMVMDVEMYHGDSIQDLGKKMFFFRRPITQEVSTPGGIPFYGYAAVIKGNGVGGFDVTWQFTLPYNFALDIINNPELLSVNYLGETYTIEGLYTSLGYSGFRSGWNVILNTVTGLYTVVLNPLSAFDQPIFSSIDNFAGMYIQGATGTVVVVGYEAENNEQRQSWKRYGVDENRRFGLCLGRICHDVQPAPFPKIEGTLFGIYGPRELLQFNWIGNKTFIPLNMALDLSQGKTNVVMAQDVYENINDYIYE